jgi:O-antigen/teichoic acid export membrane protein
LGYETVQEPENSEVLVAAAASGAPSVSQVNGTRRQTAIRWVSKGGFAIADQALISGSNFLVATLLARWVSPAEYGAYSLVFSIFLLLTIIYQAVLLEPMMIFGGTAGRDSIRGYLRTLYRIHFAGTAVMFVILALSAAAASRWGPSGVSGALVGAAIASPCVLLFWLLRRAFYLDGPISRAAAGAVVYSLVLLSGFLVLQWRGLMSSFTAFACMGAAAVATSLVLYRQLQTALPDGPYPRGLLETWNAHWRYGRWALLGSVASWFPAYIYYPLLTTFSGIAQSGELRALMNFAQPLAQFYGALSPVFLPYCARQKASRGNSGIVAAAGRITLLFVIVACGYWAVAVPFRSVIFRIVYGSHFSNITYLLPAVALGSLLWSAAIGVSIALRAMESPKSIFDSFLVASALAVAIGIPATKAFGVSGAVWSMNASDAVAIAVLLYLFRAQLGRAKSSQAAGNAKSMKEIRGV